MSASLAVKSKPPNRQDAKTPRTVRGEHGLDQDVGQRGRDLLAAEAELGELTQRLAPQARFVRRPVQCLVGAALLRGGVLLGVIEQLEGDRIGLRRTRRQRATPNADSTRSGANIPEGEAALDRANRSAHQPHWMAPSLPMNSQKGVGTRHAVSGGGD